MKENSPPLSSVRGDCFTFQQHAGSPHQTPYPPAGGKTRDGPSLGRGQRSEASDRRRIFRTCLRSDRRSSRISTAFLIPSPVTISTRGGGGQTRDRLSPGQEHTSESYEQRISIHTCLWSDRRSSPISTAFLIPSPSTLSTPRGWQTQD